MSTYVHAHGRFYGKLQESYGDDTLPIASHSSLYLSPQNKLFDIFVF